MSLDYWKLHKAKRKDVDAALTDAEKRVTIHTNASNWHESKMKSEAFHAKEWQKVVDKLRKEYNIISVKT